MDSRARRTFLALWPPRELQQALFDAAAPALPAGARVYRPHELHVTLVFLGAVEPGLAAELDLRAAGIAAGRRAPELAVRGAGAFPERGRERVLWAGIDETGPPGLSELQRELAAACAELGFAPEERPWSPHVTLARLRPGAGLRVARRFYALDFDFSWIPDGVARVVSQPGASETERYVVAARHAFSGA
jgi:2'-5' RNA ligase